MKTPVSSVQSPAAAAVVPLSESTSTQLRKASRQHAGATLQDRRRGGGFERGLPKKGGAGGKGTWGKPGDESFVPSMDINDPNYDEFEMVQESDVVYSRPKFGYDALSQTLLPHFGEFFENGDVEEFKSVLEELGPCYEPADLVLIGLNMTMDKKNSDRELFSLLLPALMPSILSSDDIKQGFMRFFMKIPDLKLDCPDVVEVTSKFLARAIADDCVAPCFLKKMGTIAVPAGQEVLRQADILLNRNHGYVRLDQVWGTSGGRRTVKMLTNNIVLALEEYLSSEDAKEVERCLLEMDVPHFHHEVVFEAVYMALNINKKREVDLLCALLTRLFDSGLLTSDQIRAGFRRISDNIQDLRLDIPNAPSLLESFITQAIRAGFVTERIMPSVAPQRKRLVSEGDGGIIKAF